jgi:uncharacterized protein (DUF488 family)
MLPIFTVGHSTRSIEDFLKLPTAHHIRLMVDVRRYPASRRFPHFSADALRASLKSADVVYVHEPELGGRRHSRQADSPNTYWHNDQFRAFADYMQSDQFQSALERLIEYGRWQTTAILCAEAVPWRCHRNLISDALVARGIEVRHILSAEKADLHVLNAHARRTDNARIIYPAEPSAQGELFGR